jgi:hypothetical protein
MYTSNSNNHAKGPHLEAEVPDVVATSETVPAEPADEMMARRTPLLKEPVQWQHVASLWCCHLGMPLGDQSMIWPVNSLKCKINYHLSWSLCMDPEDLNTPASFFFYSTSNGNHCVKTN